MHLGIVRVGEWMYEPIPIVMMLCNIVTKSGYHRFLESYGLTDRLRVLHRRRKELNTKEFV